MSRITLLVLLALTLSAEVVLADCRLSSVRLEPTGTPGELRATARIVNNDTSPSAACGNFQVNFPAQVPSPYELGNGQLVQTYSPPDDNINGTPGEMGFGSFFAGYRGGFEINDNNSHPDHTSDVGNVNCQFLDLGTDGGTDKVVCDVNTQAYDPNASDVQGNPTATNLTISWLVGYSGTKTFTDDSGDLQEGFCVAADAINDTGVRTFAVTGPGNPDKDHEFAFLDSTCFAVGPAQSPAELAIEKTVNGANDVSVPVDSILDYEITVTNTSPDAAENWRLDDFIPSSQSLVANSIEVIEPPTGSCSASGTNTTIVSCRNSAGFELPGGATFRLQYQTELLTAGPSENRAQSEANNSPRVFAFATATGFETTDLRVIKSGPGSSIVTGNEFDYTIQADNLGPNDAVNVSLQDTLPNGQAFVSLSGPSGWSCSGLSCSTAGFPVGGSAQFTLRARATQEGQQTNTVTIGSDTADTDQSNNTDTATVTVASAADLAIAKSCPGAPVTVGSSFDCTLNVTNNGPNTAQAPVVSDALPAGIGFISAAEPAGWSCSQPTVGTVECSASALGSGASAQLTLTLVANQAGNFTNVATVSSATNDPDSANNSAEAGISSVALADLAVAKSCIPTSMLVGQKTNCQVSLRNLGPNDADTATLTDRLPAGFSLTAYTPPTGFQCSDSPGVIRCSAATFPVGSQASLLVTLQADSAGTSDNVATFGSDTSDPDSTNNAARVTLDVSTEAALSITKLCPEQIEQGAEFDCTVTVANAGPNDATNISVTDTLPNVVFISATGPAGWNCAFAAGAISCGADLLAAGATAELVIRLRGDAVGNFVNSVVVDSNTTDPNPDDNVDDAPFEITPLADLAIVKTCPADTVVVGAPFDCSLTVSNNGPSVANGAEVSDIVPGALSIQGITGPGGWTCGITNNTVSCTTTTLGVGESVQINLTLSADSAGSFINTATATSTTADPDTANNSSSAGISSESIADLGITKSCDTPIVLGDSGTCQLVATNAGPNDATSLSLADVAGAGLRLDSASPPNGWSCSTNGADIACDTAALGAGESAEITVAFTAIQDGDWPNTATISGSEGDPAPQDNEDSAVVTVTPEADLSLDKICPDTIRQGETFVCNLIITNAGPSVATAPSLLDSLPAGVSFVSASTPNGWSCAGSADQIACNGATLAAGQQVTVAVALLAEEAGAWVNSASVSNPEPEPTPDDNQDDEPFEITPVADLAITKACPSEPVLVDEPFNCALTVQNLGPGDAAELLVIDTLPAGIEYLSAAGDASCSAMPGMVTCTLPTLAADDTAVVTLTLTATETGDFVNQVVVSATTEDPDTTNNAAEADISTDALADLAVSYNCAPAQVLTTESIECEVIASNIGPNDAEDLTAAIPLPDGLQATPAGPTAWNCTESLDGWDCSLDTLVVDATGPVFLFTLASDTQRTDVLTATIDSTTPDPTSGNNIATTEVAFGLLADLEVVHVVTPGEGESGLEVEYLINLSNLGPTPAENVMLEDFLPAGATMLEAHSDDMICTAISDNALVCSVETLDAGSTPLAITVRAAIEGDPDQYTAVASATSATDDPNAANNTDDAVVLLVSPPEPVRQPVPQTVPTLGPVWLALLAFLLLWVGRDRLAASTRRQQ